MDSSSQPHYKSCYTLRYLWQLSIKESCRTDRLATRQAWLPEWQNLPFVSVIAVELGPCIHLLKKTGPCQSNSRLLDPFFFSWCKQFSESQWSDNCLGPIDSDTSSLPSPHLDLCLLSCFFPYRTPDTVVDYLIGFIVVAVFQMPAWNLLRNKEQGNYKVSLPGVKWQLRYILFKLG